MADEYTDDSVKIGNYVLKFEKDENMEPFFVRKAIDNLGENTQLKKDTLKEIKRLISEDTTLDIPLDDKDIDLYLCAYLRNCKFHVERALEKIKYSFRCRLKYPHYFSEVIPIHEEKAFQSNLLTILPERDQHGCRILVFQLGNKWKLDQCPLASIMRGIVLLVECVMLEPKTQVSGVVLIIDLEGMTYQHVLQCSPSFAKLLLGWIQESTPLRVMGVHICKQPKIFKIAFVIFKPFIKEKLRKRIHLHGNNPTSLLNHVDPEYLPISFGGKMNISMNDGLLQWNFLCHFNEDYKRRSKYGFKQA